MPLTSHQDQSPVNSSLLASQPRRRRSSGQSSTCPAIATATIRLSPFTNTIVHRPSSIVHRPSSTYRAQANVRRPSMRALRSTSLRRPEATSALPSSPTSRSHTEWPTA
ncbi:hypothetical protein OH76DRAFT_656224 [Lentinus brumalis]|uniref:Uncharacterized protein n=1 Tax=Lentinus brumalis TaxID=2498619 RepID=A0A371D7J2_9APHY|nr:hypothetical protein OH76DRAFT_656224 [Polyporus brumalis]